MIIWRRERQLTLAIFGGVHDMVLLAGRGQTTDAGMEKRRLADSEQAEWRPYICSVSAGDIAWWAFST
jgi:hypothetical protein